MKRDDESIYFMYPRNFSLKLVKNVLQKGFLLTTERPSLMADAGVQTFTEEDVQNFGIDALCRKSIPDGDNTCVVLRIPKVYLGLAEDSNIDMSPIFSQSKNVNGKNVDYYCPMNNFIYGVYSFHTGSLIPSPYYSPVCNCYGILTDEQRQVAERICNGNDANKAITYYEMISHDSEVRAANPETSVLEESTNASKKQSLEDWYLKNPRLTIAQNVWQEIPNRHKITDQEFDAYLPANNYGL